MGELIGVVFTYLHSWVDVDVALIGLVTSCILSLELIDCHLMMDI